jgi:NAD(P)-dependent dehydrogenase (short-subunit alcohol dehydrogenase family)
MNAAEGQSSSKDRFATYPSLRGRRVLISGGATGIGEAFVTRFAQQGARVAFLDIDDVAAQALTDGIERDGNPRPQYHHCDLTDIAAVREAVATSIKELGGLDVLINNAANDMRHSIDEVTPELWDRLMAVNLRHQFFVTQAAIPALRASGAGSVITMSSIAWMIPSVGLPIYVTAKAGILGLTRTLAHELGKDNIRVNCLLPGAIVTEKQRRLWVTPQYSAEILGAQALKRHLEPDEVASMALFLAADDSSAMTGQGYVIDGGWV